MTTKGGGDKGDGGKIVRLVPGSKRRRIAVSDQALALAGRHKHRPADPFSIFRATLHPPIAAAGDQATMALDAGFNETAGWAYASFAAAGAALESEAFVGFPMLSTMLLRPEFRNPVETIAGEMTRKFIEFKARAGDGGKSERIAALTDKLEALGLRENMRQHLINAFGFGRGHLFIDTGDTDDKAELKTDIGDGGRSAASAFKMAGKKLHAVKPIEPVWISPMNYESSDPLKPHWYRPTSWLVNGTEVHASRLLCTIPHPVADILKPAYAMGGEALPQIGRTYVDNWLRVRQATTRMVESYSIFALGTDLAQALSGGAGDDIFKRISLFNAWRSNEGSFVYDKATEDLKNVAAPIAGIGELQQQALEQLASVFKIPLVKLLGISPSGLNASSEGELRVFYDNIAALQQVLVRPLLQVIIDLCSIELFGDVDSDISFDFIKLWETTELEAAQIRAADAATDATLVDIGSLSPEEVRARVAADPNSGYNDLDPMTMPEPPEEDADATGAQRLLPAPEPDDSDGVLASRRAWAGATAALARSGGVRAPEPVKAVPEPAMDAVESSFEAWHGSAAKFDAFSLSHVGGGEGQSGLGEGIYLAEDPATALWYVNELKAQDPNERGYLYEVRVDVDPADLILWDLGLGEQTPAMQIKIARVLASANIDPADVSTPADMIERLPGFTGSLLMLSNGIAGVKYLDGFSRAPGSASHTFDYCIFDPSKIEVLSRTEAPASGDVETEGVLAPPQLRAGAA